VTDSSYINEQLIKKLSKKPGWITDQYKERLLLRHKVSGPSNISEMRNRFGMY
jgi:hypothetical protein